ncbi:unnamed protein product [Symbiodinium natans]|uniref:Uncharacterized protein n=1 Tax=Symbiodinium natans TaxID=878477 RepID=A0A812UBX3_9DINO|nr:unnamed protein product [Symbiodinium natans]
MDKLGQVYDLHVMEVQQLRAEIRALQSKARSIDAQAAEGVPPGDLSDSLGEQQIEHAERQRQRSCSDEGIEFTQNASISKPWNVGKKRGLSKRHVLQRSTSTLRWDGQLRSCLRRWIKMPWVDCMMSMLILCNALVFAVEVR